MSASFLDPVGHALGFTIPAETYFAMDYHLFWLHGVRTHMLGQSWDAPFPNGDGITDHSNRDSDSLLAVSGDGVSHLVFLEVKTDDYFKNKQLREKPGALTRLVGEDGHRWPGVQPHLILVSPTQPTSRLSCTNWPRWAAPQGQPIWVPLATPDLCAEMQVCTVDGKETSSGTYFKLVQRRWRRCRTT